MKGTNHFPVDVNSSKQNRPQQNNCSTAFTIHHPLTPASIHHHRSTMPVARSKKTLTTRPSSCPLVSTTRFSSPSPRLFPSFPSSSRILMSLPLSSHRSFPSLLDRFHSRFLHFHQFLHFTIFSHPHSLRPCILILTFQGRPVRVKHNA